MKNQDFDTKTAVAYYDSISVKPYVHPFLAPGEKERPLPPIESILALNKDVESFVLQASAGRSHFFKDTREVLTFAHLSDVHGVLEAWNRMTEYVNHYSDLISFAIHTGDYCGDSQAQYVDCYAEGLPSKRPILNVVGNHDTVDDRWITQEKHKAWEKLFNHTENWGAVFMEGEDSMTYYKDFPDSDIRLIALDLYYDVEAQIAWLKKVLADAKEKGLWVITAMHQPTGRITPEDVTFQTITDFPGISGCNHETNAFDDVLGDFIDQGGQFICNLAGHYHADWFGYTERGVLNIAVECASDWAGWCDSKRTRGTRAFDCFNVVSVDTNIGLLKLVRIGDNADSYLRIKRTLSFDYINKKVIYNG